MTETKLADFVKSNKIRFRCEWAENNPHMDDSANMDNWKCQLRCNGRTMTVYFSKGIGHHGAEPTAEELLDCLASDASSVENTNGFEDWAVDLGYDTDSRKAHRTYKTIERQASKLKALLGDDAYDQLLWHTERL
jgi:hypothetical protein